MRKFTVFISFLIFALQISYVFSQRNIEGHILSEKTKQGIPYAMIQVVGEKSFFYADEKGFFKITASDSLSKLLITSSGFVKKEINLPLQAKKIALDITLKVSESSKKEVKPVKKPETPAINPSVQAQAANGQPQALNLTEIQKKLTYPSSAGEVEGSVVMRVSVNEEGNYISHIVLKEVHPLFVTEVEKYIKEIRFTPVVQNGKAIKYSINVPFYFKLE